MSDDPNRSIQISGPVKAIYFGKPVMFNCDRQCNKAFGRSLRPRLRLSDETVIFYGDKDVDEAPHVTGLVEGASDKPLFPSEFPTPWCAHSCERCIMAANDGEAPPPDVKQFPSIAFLMTKDAGKKRHVSEELEKRERALLTAALSEETAEAIYPIIKHLSPQQAGKVRLWAINRMTDLSGKSKMKWVDPMPTWVTAIIRLSELPNRTSTQEI